MKLTLLSVGKIRGAAAELVGDYENRAARYFAFASVQVAQETARGPRDAVRVQDAEAARLLQKMPAGTEWIALHRGGAEWSSVQLARYLAGLALHGHSGATFVIGGAFGLAPALLERCTHQLSLSAMTLPHDLARLMLAEQLYRAGTIARGEPYHKGNDGHG